MIMPSHTTHWPGPAGTLGIEVKHSTKLKSMIATIAALSTAVSVACVERGLPIPPARPVCARFRAWRSEIVAAKGLVQAQEERLSQQYAGYLDLVLTGLASDVPSEAAQRESVATQQRTIYDTLMALAPEVERLLLASNAISACILAFTHAAVQEHGQAEGNAVIALAVRRMGEYAASSLGQYLHAEGDSPLAYAYKVFAWTFINGNPEMKMVGHRRDDKSFLIEQTGECRQWRNSAIVGCRADIVWPINIGFFEAAARQIDPLLEVSMGKKQCHGDAICEFHCRLGPATVPASASTPQAGEWA